MIILCLDDEKNIVNSLRRLFVNEGFTVHGFTDPEEAIKFLELKKNVVDIIISDYRMPGMTGTEFLAIAKQIDPDVKRVMLSGHADLDIVIEAVNHEAIHKFMTKPWDNDDLIEIVNALYQKKLDAAYDSGNETELRTLGRAIEESNFETIKAVANAIEIKDPYTRGHSFRVMEFSENIAKKLEFSEHRLTQLKYAAILHDAGKIGVPAEILNKPSRLTDEEFAEIKKHPEKGFTITRGINFLKDVSRMILEHHERIDGRGYPSGKFGDEMLLESKILAVTDTYDAMTSNRAYRNAFPQEKAKNILKEERGKQLDSKIVDVFLEII